MVLVLEQDGSVGETIQSGEWGLLRQCWRELDFDPEILVEYRVELILARLVNFVLCERERVLVAVDESRVEEKVTQVTLITKAQVEIDGEG